MTRRRDPYAVRLATETIDDPPSVGITLSCGLVGAWDDHDEAALVAFGQPSQHDIDRAAAHVAGVLGRIGMLIVSPEFQCELPSPHIALWTDGLRHSSTRDRGPQLHIQVARKDRKRWVDWLRERLAEIAVVTSYCEHGKPYHLTADRQRLICAPCEVAAYQRHREQMIKLAAEGFIVGAIPPAVQAVPSAIGQ